MIKIAITGGIGSGKSTICKLFNELGIDSFDTDTVAKQQYTNPFVKEEVLKMLEGNEVMTNGEIDIKLLSKLCFSDTTIVNKLTQIISQGLYNEYDTFLKESKSPYTLFESAIILTSDKHVIFDKMIGIVSDKELRIKRVMDRSKLTVEEINSRIDKQVSDEEIKSKCHYIIENNGTLEDLKKQVLEIHTNILKELVE